MFASTPVKPHGTTLPPLSELLHGDMSPLRPRLPLISAFTPQTPRHVLPSLRLSSTLPTPLSPPAHTRPRPAAANTSMDSEADTSGNDSMLRPAKRKTVSPTRDFAFISHLPATFPLQEPLIDNASLARRKRRRTSPNELAVLNAEFAAGSTPDKARRLSIADKVNMSEKAVQIWFQNKRQLVRRSKSSEREVTELPPTPVLAPAATPHYSSTPVRPPLGKTHLAAAGTAGSAMSPTRSASAPSLRPRESVLSKILASQEERLDLVLNPTTKKQPTFARLLPASNHMMMFKLAPRKPLGIVTNTINNTTNNTVNNRHSGKDSQCVQSLLLLKAASH